MFFEIISFAGYAIEALGVMIIIIGIVQAVFQANRRRTLDKNEELYRQFHREIGRIMMIGLDFLVAGDIIRTVVVAHSLSDIASLGLLVLIRTVLVFTIHLEVEGRWPWQHAPEDDTPSASG